MDPIYIYIQVQLTFFNHAALTAITLGEVEVCAADGYRYHPNLSPCIAHVAMAMSPLHAIIIARLALSPSPPIRIYDSQGPIAKK